MMSGWGILFMFPAIFAFVAINYPPNIVGMMLGWWMGFGTFGG
jgi:hypothetical protein